MSEPLSIPRFIAVVTDEPLPPETVRQWFKCVKTHAPGLLLNIPSTDNTGMPRTVCLVHREEGAQHRYMVPLARDLEEDEAARIVDAFVDLNPEKDFDVQSSASHDSEPQYQRPVIDVDEKLYVDLCLAWAKRQHDAWVADRKANGWRYGTTLSMSEKTNPLLMPWEQLPEQYRKPDLEEPQALLDLLNSQGYAVITKAELEAMLDLIRAGTTAAPLKPTK